MNGIKILLIIAFLAMWLWAFRNRRRAGLRAGARVVIAVLVLGAITAVLEPDLTTKLANKVGVVRGTDLVLYVLVVVFAATSAGMYFRFKDLEQKFVELVREISLRNPAPPLSLDDNDGIARVIGMPVPPEPSDDDDESSSRRHA